MKYIALIISICMILIFVVLSGCTGSMNSTPEIKTSILGAWFENNWSQDRSNWQMFYAYKFDGNENRGSFVYEHYAPYSGEMMLDASGDWERVSGNSYKITTKTEYHTFIGNKDVNSEDYVTVSNDSTKLMMSYDKNWTYLKVTSN